LPCTRSPPVPSELLVREDRDFGLDPDPPAALDGSSLIVNLGRVSDRPRISSRPECSACGVGPGVDDRYEIAGKDEGGRCGVGSARMTGFGSGLGLYDATVIRGRCARRTFGTSKEPSTVLL
jgi:hypothetical protein